MTAATDTPLCLIHDDGHVLSVAATGQARSQLRRHHATLTALAVPGLRLAEMPWDEAVTSLETAKNCTRCTVTMPCGCAPAVVAAGRCGHGTLQQVRQVMRDLP
jgi:hypothetical protein